MDHDYIEEHQVADRYAMGTLPAAEAERFEEHYLSCPECLDRLELAESMQRGFRRVASEDAERLATARQLAWVAWLARPRPAGAQPAASRPAPPRAGARRRSRGRRGCPAHAR